MGNEILLFTEEAIAEVKENIRLLKLTNNLSLAATLSKMLQVLEHGKEKDFEWWIPLDN